VVLECANGVLRLIAVMHVWRDQLEGGIPLKSGGFFISGAGFVIQDLEINREPTGCQASHDSIVGGDAVAVTLDIEGLLEDEVAVGVEGNHYRLVAGESSDREAAGDVGKELAEMTNTWLDGIEMGGGRITSGVGNGGLGFVDQSCWDCWARWPMIVLSASGHYLAALE
jgi:hypothetical protein